MHSVSPPTVGRSCVLQRADAANNSTIAGTNVGIESAKPGAESSTEKKQVRSFKYRIRPNKAQAAALDEMLADFCALYNAALQQRIEAWSRQRKHISFFGQASEIKAVRAECPELARWSFSAAERTLRRLDQTFTAFFRRGRGFPRFRAAARYHSANFEFGHGLTLKKSGRLGVVGVPDAIKVRWHRCLPRRPKTAVISRQAGKWFVIFHVEVDAASVRDDFSPVGIDLGLNALVAFSDGRAVERPGFTKSAAKKQRRLQRALARKRRLSSGWKRAKRDLARHSAAVARRRRDFAHKLARQIVTEHSHTAVEDLNIKGLAGGMLAKDIRDAAWGMLLRLMHEKAASAACVITAVDPRGTSQECPECGAIKAKTLAERTHRCECGCVLDRDVAAAKVILSRAGFQGPGAGLVASSQPVAAQLAAEVASDEAKCSRQTSVATTTTRGQSGHDPASSHAGNTAVLRSACDSEVRHASCSP